MMIATNDDELLDWLNNAADERRTDSHSFLRKIAEAGLRADAENYPELRPVLLKLQAKYPQYNEPKWRDD